jgi:hypothetical protein
MHIFTPLQVEEIVRLYVTTSSSTRDIAKIYTCSPGKINRILRQNNVEFDLKAKISAKNKGNTYKRGKKLSPESCKRISESQKGKRSPTLGKVYTAEERKNISEGVKRAFAKNPMQRVVDARLIGVHKITKARHRCKLLLHRVLKVTGRKKATKTYEALGYTEKDLIKHLEAQFTKGMNWEDRESFHIDHIKPVSWFIHQGITDPKIINALSNLRPMIPTENRSKSTKLLYLI